MIEWRKVALAYPCEVCGSPPGVNCITLTGNRCYTPHRLRSAAASKNHWRDPDDVGHSPSRDQSLGGQVDATPPK
jgi:hypothetical protein